MRNFVSRCFRAAFGRRRPERTTRSRLYARPRLEALEDRIVPATSGLISAPPPAVSTAFGPVGQVLELVSPHGTLTQVAGGSAQVLGGGVRAASVAFGPGGEELLITSQNGALTLFDALGSHVLANSGVLSASLAFGPQGEVAEVVTLDGTLTQFDSTGAHLLGGGVSSTSVAFGPLGETLAVVAQDGTLRTFDAAGPHLLGGGVLAAGVAFTPQNTPLFDIIFQTGQLEQFDSAGTHVLGPVFTPPPPTPTPTPTPASTQGNPLISLNLNPLDINLLGLEIQTNQIQVNISAQPGAGELLGNLLTDATNLLNIQGVNNALNNVLGSVVSLLNSSTLNVSGVTSGAFDTATAATTPVLDLFVAPVHLNLLGALVDTSPIHLTITAHSGPGLVLGNVITDLANLFNPPLPSTLTLDTINADLQNLLTELNAQIPGIGSVATTTPATPAGTEQILSLAVPPIDVNLLGLVLKTSQIQVNVDAQTGNGLLLGNVLTTLLNTLGATPQNLTDLSNNLNALLGKVIGVLNASSLTLPSGAVNTLSQVLQTLALPNLVNASGTASAPILNLAIASTDGSTPPVDVNLLGLTVTTSNIQAQLIAQTGDGQILGNLLYNVANLLNPGGTLNLLSILGQLAL